MRSISGEMQLRMLASVGYGTEGAQSCREEWENFLTADLIANGKKIVMITANVD